MVMQPKQLRLPIGKGRSRETPPIPWVVSGARRYAQERGMNWTQPSSDVRGSPERGHALYLAYRNALRSSGETPNIRASYQAMREHIAAQHEFMTRPQEKGGMGVRFEVAENDPYPSPKEMHEDLTRNRRIKVFPARTTPHEFFSSEELERFRAVHDVFGHAATGRGFSRHGEEAAWRSHRQMFPQEAQSAVASDLRGQNAWLNYGPGGFVSQNQGKLVGLPAWAESTAPAPAPRKIRRTGERQMSLF
jgi:hypothetical protein